uniref:Uncharacterized protein AlNc14C19G1989 n=1 Tax=Albugo laibachii Nc14 TaxID=890382 RepID=F0W518_9STRA|nr:conserved hypothetical protein [Albugo laibachii Nc14]|eukprot:CCA16209.1 conserved hypothetical protein [Albugo laibachii Nc14]
MDEELSLSSATLAALQEFAQENGVVIPEDSVDIRKDIQKALDCEPKEDTFTYTFGSEETNENNGKISIHLKGLRRDIGQTLQSTGLTLWPAGDILCDFLYANQALIRNQSVVELGSGLGLCGILAAHFADRVVMTDGDDETLPILEENCKINQISRYECKKLLWGVSLDQWNDKFQVVLGADIVYDKDCLDALIQTATHLLSEEGIFILAFTKRNVSIDAVLETAARYKLHQKAVEKEGIYLFHL